MPLSQNYTARVPVATGNIHDNTYKLKDTSLRNPSDSLASTTSLDDIYKLVMFIRQDEFWNAQIQQLVVDEKAEVTMIPRVGNQEIALGQVKDLEKSVQKTLDLLSKRTEPNRMGSIQENQPEIQRSSDLY